MSSFIDFCGVDNYSRGVKRHFPRSLSMIQRKLCVLWLAAMCVTFPVLGQAQGVAGVVKKSDGSVTILRDGKDIPVEVGTVVMAGDVVRTAASGSAGVMLKDETRMSLGPNSQVSLERYAFNADTHQGNMFVNILKGTMMMISGLIVKTNPDAAKIKTPTGTVGIRGTEFIVDVP